MVEDLENEVTDLVARISVPSSADVKKIDELTKHLKDEREQTDKLANEKKKADEQLAKLEAELKKGNSANSGRISLLIRLLMM